MSTIIENDKTLTSQLTEVIPAPGVGNPDSPISMAKYLDQATPENQRKEIAESMHEIIANGECYVTCTHDDDGCLDGRCTSEIAVPNGEGFEVVNVEHNKDNERAKVAGGGYTTSLAMFVALNEKSASPESDIVYIAEEFAKQGIHCGAHTGGHGSEDLGKTDCGANDKVREIIACGANNREIVAGVTSALFKHSTDLYGQGSMNKALNAWTDTQGDDQYFANSNGVSRLDAIRTSILNTQDNSGREEKVAVIKNLKDDHNEIELVVVYGQGQTFSQTKLRNLLAERYPAVDAKDLPQVFVLDFWRVQQLAYAVAVMPERESGRERTDQEIQDRYATALHAGVAFQVATYATLTDGSLPVDIIA